MQINKNTNKLDKDDILNRYLKNTKLGLQYPINDINENNGNNLIVQTIFVPKFSMFSFSLEFDKEEDYLSSDLNSIVIDTSLIDKMKINNLLLKRFRKKFSLMKKLEIFNDGNIAIYSNSYDLSDTKIFIIIKDKDYVIDETAILKQIYISSFEKKIFDSIKFRKFYRTNLEPCLKLVYKDTKILSKELCLKIDNIIPICEDLNCS